ncbi:coiled-coil domain-containing protein 187 isoform X2 [Danio aesculapii]|uniref:coiled-coil domain-containing protein 187 isoform X2 n=1 Tax=Danio aesculapii TaxID=1142201 RepID=UPI0024BFD462|nr:coiled-coil domain-containing protein 187 isoform X2 [Danio aesculapii]
MMAELEVDQSNLPRVQEVCQCFAVLEDGALAHNLQEQEIEQYYSSNVERSQLVQKDIRVAKRLQDEEQQRVQTLEHQTTRQLEERDSEYARMIQEEIQRCAEEARRREVEDEEIAKRIQEEELCLRHRSSYQNKDVRESISVPARPYSPQPVQTSHNRSPTSRWQHSISPNYSDFEEDLIEYSRPTVIRQARKPVVEHRRSSRAHLEQDDRSVTSQNSSSRSSQLSGGWGDVVQLIKNDMSEQGYLSYSSEDDLFEPVYRLEKILRKKKQVSETRLNRHSSVRQGCRRSRQGDGCSHTESFSERRVHFLDERRRTNSCQEPTKVGCRTNENGISDSRERVHCSTGLIKDDHTRLTQSLQPQGFRRNISMRRSYHGNVRRTSVPEGSRTCSIDDSNLGRARPTNDGPLLQPRARQSVQVEDRLRDTSRWEMVRSGNSRQRALSLTEAERRIDRDHRHGERRVRRIQSERWQTVEEERSSTEEELERESRRKERWIQRPQFCSGRSPGAGPVFRSGTTALDMGELEQVLRDEELARRLQEEEERLVEEAQHASSPLSSRDCPVGDFRAAQVAQDEEIARFIQKQEIKVKRSSRELESAGQEFREIERRATCDRQRRRLDSEGLRSPVDDFTPDHPGQMSTPVQTQAIKNIAEELDPTFQRKNSADDGKINGQHQTSPQAGSYNPLDEPTFIPPTKRQSEKLGRVKTKEKKENVKQKENCKQQ